MTDVATTTEPPVPTDTTSVEPAAPASTPATPTPAPTGEPEGPLSRRDARRGLHQDRPKPTPVTESATPPAATPGAASETPAAATPLGTAAPAVAPAAAPVIPILIPEGHPLREMGLEQLVAHSALEERAIRAMLNSHVRRQEVAQRDQTISELQRELVQIRSGQAAEQKWKETPGYKAAVERYHEIKETYGQEAADVFWRGVAVEFTSIADTEYQTRMQQIESQNTERAAQSWKMEAWQNANRLPEPIRRLADFPRWFDTAVQSFNAELELGHYPQVRNAEELHQEFTRFFGSRLVREPAVVAAFKAIEEEKQRSTQAAADAAAAKEREREAIASAAVEQFKQDAAAKRQTVPPHPLGNLVGASRDHVPAAPASDEERLAGLTPQQLRKASRTGAREDARRRFGP